MHDSFFDSDTPGEFPESLRKNKKYHVSFRGRKPGAPPLRPAKRHASKSLAERIGSPKMGRSGGRRKKAPAEREPVKKRHWVLIAMMTAGTATFFFALLRQRVAAPVTPYHRPEGGEREGEFQLFIGS